MDRRDLLQQVLNRRVKDYSYPVVFFIIFSVFLYFAIRPNLVTAFTLQQELEQLRIQDDRYETVILSIVKYQNLIEKTRGDFALLEDAVPDSPEIFGIVRDIRVAATSSGMTIRELEISQVALKKATDPDNPGAGDLTMDAQKNLYTIKFTVPTTFTDVQTFMRRLTSQRRLKTVEAIRVFSSSQQGTSSAVFNFSFEVKGYYL